MIFKSILLLSVLSICCHADIEIHNEQRFALFDIDDQFKPEIEKIHESVEGLSNDMTDVDETISAAITRLYLMKPESDLIMDTLKNIVKQTVEESTSIDASACLKDENLAENNLQLMLDHTTDNIAEKFQPSYENHSKELSVLKSRLPGIIDQADKVIHACILQNLLPWQHDKLVLCIRKDIDRLNEQIDRLRLTTNTIYEKVTGLLSDMEAQMGEILETVVHSMVTIIEQLKECISMLTTHTEVLTTTALPSTEKPSKK